MARAYFATNRSEVMCLDGIGGRRNGSGMKRLGKAEVQYIAGP